MTSAKFPSGARAALPCQRPSGVSARKPMDLLRREPGAAALAGFATALRGGTKEDVVVARLEPRARLGQCDDSRNLKKVVAEARAERLESTHYSCSPSFG